MDENSGSTSKKILIALTHTSARGDSLVILNLLHALPNRADFEFSFLVQAPGELHADFAAFGEIYAFPFDDRLLARRILRRISTKTYGRIKQRYFHRLIEKINPQVIYINTVNPHELSIACLNARRRLLVHPHEFDFAVTLRMKEKWIRNLLGKANLVIYPAMAVQRFYSDVFGMTHKPSTVIYSTVSDERLHMQKFKEPQISAYGALKIGGAGAVTYGKGVDLFIRACAIVREETDKLLNFSWMGGDLSPNKTSSYLDSLFKLVEAEGLNDAFQFLPHARDVKSYYGSLDIFVMPSRSESLGIVALEAMLMEKPVIALAGGGVGEVLTDDSGILVKDRSPEGLASAMLNLVNSATLREKLGVNGRQRVLRNFEAKIVAERWAETLKNA